MKQEEGCCVVCARLCHKGHSLSEKKQNPFFCDCSLTGFCNALPADQVEVVHKDNTPSIVRKLKRVQAENSLVMQYMQRSIGINLLFNRYVHTLL